MSAAEEELKATVSRLRKQQSDDSEVEVKATGGGLSKDVWRSVSAFANSVKGGQIILGLREEDDFRVVGDFQPVSITDAFVAGMGDSGIGAAQVQPAPEYTIQTIPLEEGQAVKADIRPLTSLNSEEPGPCHVVSQGIQGGSYKRVADQNQKLSDLEIYSIRSRWVPREFDKEQIDGMTIADLDEDLVIALFQRVRSSGSRALERTENDTQKLERLSVVSRTGGITLAGGLTIGQYPQQFFPRFVIDVTAHPHKTKDVAGGMRFLDRKVCDGPIPLMIQDAVTRVLANLKTIRVVRGAQGIDEPEIPEDVLREAITNAAMHRDYSHFSRGERISVEIYPDRVEITSPGGLIADRTKENIADGESVTRNPALATLLRITPIPGERGVVAETQGSGIPQMLAGMRDHGLPQPKFDAGVTWVKVTLYRHGLLDGDTRLWLNELQGSASRQHREHLALALMRHNSQATVQDLREKLGYDSDDVRQMLGSLQADGLIEGRGDGPYAIASNVAGRVIGHEQGQEFTGIELEVYSALSTTERKTIRELAEELGRNVNSLRPVLRRLVDVEMAIPTAPPQSRKRAYLQVASD